MIRRLVRDGVALACHEAGSGAPPVVLVHGWACDHSFMAPQLEHYRSTHRTIAVDLRGHGHSDRPVQDYPIAGFADDVAWICEDLALEKPVLVGHSMGGAIALELAAQRPEVPAAIVLLDSAVLPAPSAWAGAQPVIAALHTADFRGVLEQFLGEAFFLPTDDQRRKARIIEAMLSRPRHVLAPAFEGIFAWDGAAAARRCRIPMLYIASSRPRSDVARLRELCPQLVTGQVVSAGHFAHLEVPEQVNAMIDRFLGIDVPRG